jgi:hypothetical protein
MLKIHVFGKNGEWGISVDDGCLMFHPQMNSNPSIYAKHIWKEAFEEVNKLGGFDEAIKFITSS